MNNLIKNVTGDQINDLMVTALEGGINYWCDQVEIIKGDNETPADVIKNGGEIKLYDCESDETWTMNKEQFLEGCVKTIKHYEFEDFNDMYDSHDAETADVIIQFACMGEIVFG